MVPVAARRLSLEGFAVAVEPLGTERDLSLDCTVDGFGDEGAPVDLVPGFSDVHNASRFLRLAAYLSFNCQRISTTRHVNPLTPCQEFSDLLALLSPGKSA